MRTGTIRLSYTGLIDIDFFDRLEVIPSAHRHIVLSQRQVLTMDDIGWKHQTNIGIVLLTCFAKCTSLISNVIADKSSHRL